MARNALGAAAFYVRQHSREPENTSGEQVNGANISSETSYDYAQEEKEFQAQKKINPAQRKNRMSVDNKAYKPSRESEEELSEYSDDDGKKKRRKKTKKGPLGGPLTSLPTVGSDKRRRKKGRGPKGAGGDDDFSSGEEDQSMDIVRFFFCLFIHANLESSNLTTSVPLTHLCPNHTSTILTTRWFKDWTQYPRSTNLQNKLNHTSNPKCGNLHYPDAGDPRHLHRNHGLRFP